VLEMVEMYKVIVHNIPSLNQIFDDENKNGSDVKGANNNAREFVCQPLAAIEFFMMRKIDIFCNL